MRAIRFKLSTEFLFQALHLPNKVYQILDIRLVVHLLVLEIHYQNPLA